MREVTPQEGLQLAQAGALLVDVREPDEYGELHAQGAATLPLSELEARFRELPQNRDLVLICRSGVRSLRAAEFLQAQGYTQLFNLTGGTLAWQEAGLPVVTAKQSESGASLPTAEQVLEALKVVKDPEIPVNVVDLGLVYNVDISPSGVVDISMTLTSVGCPVQDLIRADAEMAVMRLDGVERVNVEFVWSPPWSPDKMSEDGKRQMRMFGFNI